ncbi:DUF4400 domain-containing protein [Sinirhodobacter populi]|uniref:DUF4400 domain-containing protein n=1 Tax=Paenirhodobacter populi TaxID=2306993 RepID=A0A443KCJ5_9RHOB|nr:DUF4400 domain-containing protein [Sinirhodobacter populi]RWR30559.1 DUF4400 domain-containing protein [Sinirhodobacter populi]
MAGEPQSPYDTLFPTRVFFFIALIMLGNLIFVGTYYPFMSKEPFGRQMNVERERFETMLSPRLQERMRFNGDVVYDAMFVDTGVEKVSYNWLTKPTGNVPGSDKIMQIRIFGQMLNDLFDYLLTLTHRLGFFIVAMTYLAWFVVALTIHGVIVRHRKRYGFGDTPILMNLWARTLLAYAIPITFMIWTWPTSVHPMFLVISLVTCVGGLAIFAFSMPKIA